MANLLLPLADGGLQKKLNKSYVVLERKLGYSNRDKNAVSLLRKGVSFMVTDFSAQQEAESLGLFPRRSEKYRRLIFPKLTLKDVELHAGFFAKLVQDAKLESERLQAYHNVAFTPDQQHPS